MGCVAGWLRVLLPAMTRRFDLEPGYQRWLGHLGAAIARQRARRGWTQTQAAAAAELEFKQYQDIEYGRRPVTTRTLYAIAVGFDLQLRELLDEPPIVLGTGEPATALTRAGWSVVEAQGRRKPARALPIFDLTAVADKLGQSQPPPVIGWASPPDHTKIGGEGLFVAQVQSAALEPLVAAGEWCLFRQPVREPLLGKAVLVRSYVGECEDSAWIFCSIGLLELRAGECLVRLDALNPEHASCTVQLGRDAELLGEWLQVIR